MSERVRRSVALGFCRGCLCGAYLGLVAVGFAVVPWWPYAVLFAAMGFVAETALDNFR